MTEYVVGISVMVAGVFPFGEGVDSGTGVPTVVSTDGTAVVVLDGEVVVTVCGRDDVPEVKAQMV